MEGLLKVGLRALIKTLEEREPEPQPEAKNDDEVEETALDAQADAVDAADPDADDDALKNIHNDKLNEHIVKSAIALYSATKSHERFIGEKSKRIAAEKAAAEKAADEKENKFLDGADGDNGADPFDYNDATDAEIEKLCKDGAGIGYDGDDFDEDELIEGMCDEYPN